METAAEINYPNRKQDNMSTFAYGKVDTTPEKAPYSAARLQRLSDYYESLIDTKRVQATGFLMARGGKVFAHQAAGQLKHNDPSSVFGVDSIKRVASITKVFTAAAVMKLIEDGKLWLKQEVREVIPEFDTSLHRTISLWHLLTHTSGLPADPGYFLEPYPIEWYNKTDCDEWVKAILSGPILCKPGESWNYSSLGFNILAEVVSRVSGQHFNRYLEDEIFKPIGMTRSFMDIPESLRSQVVTLDDMDAERIARVKDQNKVRAPNGAGGAYSTLYDLFRFGQCFLNGGTLDGVRLLGRKVVEIMTRNQLESVPAFHWGANCKAYPHGLGWGFYCDGPAFSPGCYNHEGYGWCSLFVDPKEDFIFVSMYADNTIWDPKVMVVPRTIAWSGII